MKILIFLFILFFNFNLNQKVKVGKVLIYKKFINGGTLGTLNYAFQNKNDYLKDTTMFQIEIEDKFSTILNSKNSRKLRNHKIAGIKFAGIYFINNIQYNFIILNNNFLFDLSNKCIYNLENNSLINQIDLFLSKKQNLN